MRAVFGMVLLLAGCDRLLGISHLRDDGGGADTPATGDSTSSECDLANFAATAHAFEGGILQEAVAPDKSFAIVIAGSVVYVDTPAESGLRKAIATLSGPQWQYPALAPDGQELFIYNTTDTRIYSLLRDGSSWSIPAIVGISSTSLPGSFGRVPGGERRIVVKEGTEFREYAESTGAWTAAQQTRSLKDLTGLDTGMIYYPSLTPDASTLLFVVTGSGQDGIWYSRRTNFNLADNFSTTTSAAWGRLVPQTQTLATPQLVGCQVYATLNQQLIRYDP